MNASVSAAEVLASVRAEIGSVPHVSLDFVCPVCLGPVGDYPQCYGCKRLFDAAPLVLAGRIVPMSAVANPSPWYGRLVRYKNGHAESHTVVSALAALYLTANEQHLASLLGGPISQIAVVPSTRGKSFEQQPLAGTIRRSVTFRDRLANVLSHRSGVTIARQEYKPSYCKVDVAAVRGERIVLIEDLWVSGAKAVSAAGALMDGGAASVIVVAVAREIRPSSPFCGEDHPYLAEMGKQYDVNAWPR